MIVFTPFLRMAMEEELGHTNAQHEPAPENSEYEEGEGLPIPPVHEDSEQSNTVSDAQVELTITEDPEQHDQVEPSETDPLRSGACAEPVTPTKQNDQSKMSIEDLESREDNPAKRKAFDRKCAVIGVLLLLVIIAGAIGAVFINKFSAKVSYTFRFSNYYHDHMVLQRAPSKAVVWGYGPVSTDNISVLLTIEGQGTSKEYSTNIRGQVSGGVWRIALDPKVEPGPFTIKATLKNGNAQTLELKDVLFGDVWLCAGQRNMQFSVNMLEEEERQKELEHLDDYSDMRLLALWPDQSIQPSDDIHTPLLRWSKPTPDSLLGGHAHKQYFSALCWLYGRKLYDKLRYPVGLVTATYYSSSIEDWIPPGYKQTCDIIVPYQTSTVYNTMIKPLQSTSLYGIIWYQGEDDAEERSRFYNCSLVTMLHEWRAQWYQGTLHSTDQTFPFGIVQLGAYKNISDVPSGYTDIRWQQTANYGFTPNPHMNKTFMAVAVDLPDYNNSAQPKHKSEIADRLVLGALSVAYQQKVVYLGPFPSKYAAFSSNKSLVLSIDTIELNVKINTGFEVCCSVRRGDICPVSLISASMAPGRHWVPAPIVQHTSQSVTLSWRGNAECDNDHVTAIRYLWRETPCDYLGCALYDTESGLPMAPYIKQGLVDDGKYHILKREPTNHTLV